MGDRRFPCVKYANEIHAETKKQLERDDLRVMSGGVPEPEQQWVILEKKLNLESRTEDKTVLHLHMYADERYKDRPNYVLYKGEKSRINKHKTYERINNVRTEWFKIVNKHTVDTDSEDNRQLTDFEDQ